MPKKLKTLTMLAGMGSAAIAWYFWNNPEQITELIKTIKKVTECQKTQTEKPLKKSGK